MFNKGVPLSSPFVEEFKVKLNNNKELTLFELENHFIECSLD